MRVRPRRCSVWVSLWKITLKESGIDISECDVCAYEIMPDERQKITVPLSEEDIEDLWYWAEFNWTFPDQYGNDIDILITNE